MSAHGATQPVRTCIGCGAKDARQALLRIVRREDGEVILDVGARAPGRGAWVHDRPECLARASQPRAIGRAFKGKARPPRDGSLRGARAGVEPPEGTAAQERRRKDGAAATRPRNT